MMWPIFPDPQKADRPFTWELDGYSSGTGAIDPQPCVNCGTSSWALWRIPGYAELVRCCRLSCAQKLAEKAKEKPTAVEEEISKLTEQIENNVEALAKLRQGRRHDKPLEKPPWAQGVEE